MATDAVGSRYADALFGAAKADGQVPQTLDHLDLIDQWLRGQPPLRQFLLNPDLEPEDKVGVLDRLARGAWPTLVRAFVQMVISLGRAEALQDIIEAFRALVDRDQGILRVVVRSAIPLPPALLERVQQLLGERERQRIELRTEVDPALLGGVQIRLDHRVIDGSVRRQLKELRQRLQSLPIR